MLVSGPKVGFEGRFPNFQNGPNFVMMGLFEGPVPYCNKVVFKIIYPALFEKIDP
jgi:hypothetical protein